MIIIISESLTTSTSAQLIIAVIISIPTGAIYMAIIVAFRIQEWDKQIIRYTLKYTTSSFEHWRYNDLYKTFNGSPSLSTYQLNNKFNINECSICLEEFNKYSNCYNMDILHCGHLFHRDCLREWELQQFDQHPGYKYKCPTCKIAYNWRNKYIYTPSQAISE